MAEGAAAASTLLRERKADVMIFIPEAYRNSDWSAAASKPIIDSLLKEGYQAISMPVFDKDLVPYLNQKIADGLLIATCNAEPARPYSSSVKP